MRRYRRHAFALFGFALAASVALHGVGWVELDRIAPVTPHASAPVRTSRLEFVEMDPLPATEESPVPLAAQPNPSTRPAPTTTTPVVTPPAAPEPPRAPDPILVPTPAAPPPIPPPPPPDLANRQVVEQESDDPDVEPPPDARFLAAQNRRVEEETQAEETSVRSDSPVAEPPPPDEARADSPEPEEGRAAPDESRAEVRDHAAEGETTGQSRPSASEPAATASAPPASAGGRASGASAPSGGGTPSPTFETVTIDDGFGTFTVTRPRATGSGGTSGAPRDRSDEGRSRGDRGTSPRLAVGFSTFEQIYGAETLADERRQVRAAREAASGASAERREERWQQYRFAAENFLPAIRPGNQTALNAAASPFATFLAGMHRDIHQEFAERFLPRIESSRGPLANPELFTELELVLAADGRVLSISISHTSGVSAFDLGAISSVMEAQPFDPPPDAIKSGDGRVYLIWGFSRDPIHACHVTQSRPFILPNPPPLRIMPGVTPDQPGGIAADSAAASGPWRTPAGVLRTTPSSP